MDSAKVETLAPHVLTVEHQQIADEWSFGHAIRPKRTASSLGESGGLDGELTIVLTGIRRAGQWGWLLAHIDEHGRKIHDPRPT